MSRHDITAPPLHAILTAARDFGLTEDEVWRTVAAAQRQAGPDATVSASLDDMIEAFAQAILAKERGAIAARRRGEAP